MQREGLQLGDGNEEGRVRNGAGSGVWSLLERWPEVAGTGCACKQS